MSSVQSDVAIILLSIKCVINSNDGRRCSLQTVGKTPNLDMKHPDD